MEHADESGPFIRSYFLTLWARRLIIGPRLSQRDNVGFLRSLSVITFACGCGKKLQIIDGNAGKKVKCPGCGAISPAPQLQQPTVSFPEARSLPSGEDE